MRFLRRSASLFSLQVSERTLGRDSHLFVAVFGQTFERADRGGRRGEAQRFDGDGAPAGRLAAEQAATGLGKLDQCLGGGGTADAPPRQNQFALDRLI